MRHQEASHEEWFAASKALLVKEKALSRMRDELSEMRRALPWLKVAKPYEFASSVGKKTLSDLFDGRSQLAIYHFMMAPDSNHICPGCSFLSDHVDAARMHFEHNDLSFCAVSRAPLSRILEVKQRMGWQFNWVSSHSSDFNFDFQVSFTTEQIAKGNNFYNFEQRADESIGEAPGISMFYKDEDDQIFRTYSSYARGGEAVLGAYHWLDLAPKGRNESSTMNWVRLHDEYGQGPTHQH